ncbi:MAG TPA: PAS domain S-box protein, partial [Polyangiaceae bacterium]|nr:PAS domain S-box protein [Polyangiaceae bacterium]
MSVTCNGSGHPNDAFKALAETIFDACAVCRAERNGQGQICDFRIEYVNQQASIDARVPADQLVGKSLLDVLPMFQADELAEALRRVVETGEPLTLKRTTIPDAPEADGSPTRPRRVLDIRLTRAGDSAVAVWRDVTAIAVAEHDHKNRQRLLRLVTDTIDDAFWAATPGIDESLYISPAYEQIWGRSRSELKANPRAFVDGVHPDDRPRVLAHLHQLHHERRSSSVEYRVVRPNGDLRWVHERGFWADVEPGEEPAIVGVCTDVTDRVLAEQARRRSESLLRKAESLAHVGAWEWDMVQDEVTFSDEWGKIHACTEHRLRRSALLTLVHPDDRSRLEQQYLAVIEGKLAHFEVEYRIVRHNDGQERLLVSRARRVEDDQGGPPRVIGCDQDITELKQVEQDLRASKKHLQSVYDVIGQAILSVQFPERIIDGVNRRIEELLGYSPQELIGQSTAILYPNPEAHERFGAQLRHALSEDRDRVRQELTFQRKDGKLVPCQITSTFLLERGRPHRVISVVEDISERQKTEAETAALLAAAHAVLESRDFKQAASGILDVGKWNVGARTGCIAVCEEECGFRATIWGPPGSEGPRVIATLQPTGLFYEVCLQNQVRQDNHIAESGREDPILAGLGSPKNVLIAPFSFEGKVRGIVALADKDGDFDEVDARQIRALGEITALSLQRERYVEQLLATERLLTTTGRMARVGGWELDCDTRRVSWTAVTRELHEVPENYEPTLDASLAFYPPDDRLRLESAVSAAMTQGRPFDLELRVTTAKGRDLWIHTKCTPVLEDGAVRTLIGAFQDITARKAAETAVLARERFLALITENMFDMVSLVSINGRFTYVSPSHKQLGHDPVSMTGRLVLDFVHPDDQAHVQAEVAAAMKTSERRKVEYRYRRADGSYVWIESIGQVMSRAGEPTEMIVSSRDVSDLKRYQASLHAEKETAQRYLDVAAVMLFGVDANGKVNLINRRGCEILGVPDPAALLGQDALQLIPPEEQEAALAVQNALLRGNTAGLEHFETWILTTTGEKRRIAWSNAVLRDEQNHVIGILSSGADITERRMMEAQLAKADRLSSMGLLAAGVAHELNNPLSYVLSNLEGLTEDLPEVLDTVATFFAL